MDVRKAGERPAVHNGGTERAVHHAPQRKKNPLVIAGISLIAIVLIGLGVWWALKETTGAGTAIKKDNYQAVFLTNGQVYFGKLKNSQGDYLALEDIYYLQVDSSIQPSTDDSDVTSQQNQRAANSNNVQLIKLGNELHGPEDKMLISAEQVLFWENLKTDGKVAEAIKDYKKE